MICTIWSFEFLLLRQENNFFHHHVISFRPFSLECCDSRKQAATVLPISIGTFPWCSFQKWLRVKRCHFSPIGWRWEYWPSALCTLPFPSMRIAIYVCLKALYRTHNPSPHQRRLRSTTFLLYKHGDCVSSTFKACRSQFGCGLSLSLRTVRPVRTSISEERLFCFFMLDNDL